MPWCHDTLCALQVAEIQETKVAAHGLRNSLEHGNGIPEIQEIHIGNGDVEKAVGHSTALASSPDPFFFKKALKTDKDLDGLKKSKRKREQKYYGRQNGLIIYLLRPMEEHVEIAKHAEQQNRLLVSKHCRARAILTTLITLIYHLFPSYNDPIG